MTKEEMTKRINDCLDAGIIFKGLEELGILEKLQSTWAFINGSNGESNVYISIDFFTTDLEKREIVQKIMEKFQMGIEFNPLATTQPRLTPGKNKAMPQVEIAISGFPANSKYTRNERVTTTFILEEDGTRLTTKEVAVLLKKEAFNG